MMRLLKKLIKSDLGVASVELAVTAPLLLIVTFGAYSIADAGQEQALVARAAMQGARLAVVKDQPQVQEYVRDIMKTADPSIDVNKVKVLPYENLNKIPVLSSIVKPLKITVEYEKVIFSAFGWNQSITLRKSYVYEKWNNGVFFDIPKSK